MKIFLLLMIWAPLSWAQLSANATLQNGSNSGGPSYDGGQNSFYSFTQGGESNLERDSAIHEQAVQASSRYEEAKKKNTELQKQLTYLGLSSQEYFAESFKLIESVNTQFEIVLKEKKSLDQALSDEWEFAYFSKNKFDNYQIKTTAKEKQSLQELHSDYQRTELIQLKNPMAFGLGYNALITADKVSVKGKNEDTQELMALSKSLLDVALGFAPVISTIKDFQEFTTGLNLLTGVQLSPMERSLSFIGFTGGVLTSGTAGGLIKSVARSSGSAIARYFNLFKNSKVLAKGADTTIERGVNVARYVKSEEFIEVASNLKNLGYKDIKQAEAFAKYWNYFKQADPKLYPKQIRVGDDKKIAVIGRSMGEKADEIGVKDFVNSMYKDGLDVRYFEPSSKVLKEFDRTREFYTRIPADKLYESGLFLENKDWIKKMKDENFTIMDLGNPNGKTDLGEFYKMELEELWK